MCEQVTFVGGCATSLLLTDDFTKEQVRHTDDVDLIVHVMSYSKFVTLQEQLKLKGFSVPMPSLGEEAPTCAMFLGDLRVDFMPDIESVLGFSNYWYKDAMQSSFVYFLQDDLPIRLVSPVYFIATKLEAYKGRGNNDPLESRDIEDILYLVDGREELLREVKVAPDNVKTYIARELTKLLASSEFDYAVQSQALSDADREELLFEKLEVLANFQVKS